MIICVTSECLPWSTYLPWLLYLYLYLPWPMWLRSICCGYRICRFVVRFCCGRRICRGCRVSCGYRIYCGRRICCTSDQNLCSTHTPHARTHTHTTCIHPHIPNTLSHTYVSAPQIFTRAVWRRCIILSVSFSLCFALGQLRHPTRRRRRHQHRKFWTLYQRSLATAWFCNKHPNRRWFGDTVRPRTRS